MSRVPSVHRLSVLVAILAVAIAGAMLTPVAPAIAKGLQDVFVTNTAADPIPVSGTVNVGNLPTTQAVSGTVNVGSMPMPATVNGGVTQSSSTAPGATTTVQVITNVVAVTFWSDGLAYMIIGGNDVGNGYQVTSPGHQTVAQSFYNPLPSGEITVQCDAINTSPCRWRWAVAGIDAP